MKKVNGKPPEEEVAISFAEVVERGTLIRRSLDGIITTQPTGNAERRRELLRDLAALMVVRTALLGEAEQLGVQRTEAIDFTGQLALATLKAAATPPTKH